jgi:antitoxin PrlF
MKATVSEKGQVTIPKALRTKLGIGPGAILEFNEERGRLVGRKAATRNPVDEVWGTLKLGEPVDSFLDRIRGRG